MTTDPVGAGPWKEPGNPWWPKGPTVPPERTLTGPDPGSDPQDKTPMEVNEAWDNLQQAGLSLFNSEADSFTGSHRDFEGFPTQEENPRKEGRTLRSEIFQTDRQGLPTEGERPRPKVSHPSSSRKSKRSKRKHRKKGKKRRRTSSSSSSSTDSDSEEGSPRRKRNHGESQSDMLQQLRDILIQGFSRQRDFSVEQTQHPQTVPAIAGPSTSNQLDPRNADPDTPHPETVQDLIQPETQAHPRDYNRADSDEDSDDPLIGTDITQEAFEKAVEVLRRILGFEPPVIKPNPETRKSKLTLNTVRKTPAPEMPIDFECVERFKRISESKKWTAFQLKPNRTFRIEEGDWRELCEHPVIPEGAQERLRSLGVMDRIGKYTSELASNLEKSLSDADRAARVGMKYSSTLLLFAEVLSKAFQEADSHGVSRRDTGAIVTLLGPISRLVFDQFSKIAVRTTTERRKLVLDSMKWPSTSMKKGFQDLPMMGKDLFGGKFTEHLQQEAAKQKALRETDLQFSSSSRSSFPPRINRQQPFSGRRRDQKDRGTHRPSGQSQPSRGPHSQPYRGRGFYQSNRNPQRYPGKPTRGMTRGSRRPYHP